MVGSLAALDLSLGLLSIGEAPEVTLTGDGALAREAAGGDRDAFGRLVDLHKRSVFGLCVRLLADREEARDAAQEAFVRAFAAIGSFDVARPFVPWLLRIARNHCYDLTRRRLPIDRGVESHEAPEPADDRAVQGDVALAEAETQDALDRAVLALPENYRTVITLFHVEHLTYKEIAQVQGVPIGTVMTWLHRARAQLKKALVNTAAEEA